MNPMLLASVMNGGKKALSNQWVLIGIILFAAYYFNFLGIKDKIAASKTQSAIKAYENSTVNITPKGSNVVAPALNLQLLANDIYESFHGSMWTENEEKAISLIKSVPAQLRPTVAQIYAQKGHDLYDDFRKYCRDDQYAKVEQYLR